MAFAELCVTSNFTFLTGGSHPQEYALRAIELGLPAFAIADRNSVAGLVRAHQELREAAREGGAVPRLVPAARLCLAEGPELTALPRNRAGWARLCRLLTLGARRAPKGSCELHADDLGDLGELHLLLHPPAGRGLARLAAAGEGARPPARPRPPRRQPALRRAGRRPARPAGAARAGARAAARRLGGADHARRGAAAAGRRADLHPHRPPDRRARPGGARQRRAAAALGGRDAAALRRARGGGAPGRRDRRRTAASGSTSCATSTRRRSGRARSRRRGSSG